MERDPTQTDDPLDDDDDLLGDPDDVDHVIEEHLDEHLREERDDPQAPR